LEDEKPGEPHSRQIEILIMNKNDFIAKKNLLRNQNSNPDICEDRQGRKYTFEWIDKCPFDSILKLRNAESVLQFMVDKNKITLGQHSKFIGTYSSRPRLDFMIREDLTNQYVAGVNIKLTDIGLELGKYIGNSEYLGYGLGIAMTNSFLYFIKNNYTNLLKEITVYARTMSTNVGNINLNKTVG
jgi:hypothetical protein